MIEILWKATESEEFEFFLKLTKEQAQAFFDEYLRARNERLEILNRRFYDTGGGNEDDLDFTPDSLEPLWHWARTHIAQREFNAAEVEHLNSLPEKVRQMGLISRPLSEDTRILINDIAYYFA